MTDCGHSIASRHPGLGSAAQAADPGPVVRQPRGLGGGKRCWDWRRWTFSSVTLLPLDPVIAVLGPNATHDAYVAMYKQIGLDQPLWKQFAVYLGHIVQFDFGNALTTGRPVGHRHRPRVSRNPRTGQRRHPDRHRHRHSSRRAVGGDVSRLAPRPHRALRRPARLFDTAFLARPDGDCRCSMPRSAGSAVPAASKPCTNSTSSRAPAST